MKLLTDSFCRWRRSSGSINFRVSFTRRIGFHLRRIPAVPRAAFLLDPDYPGGTGKPGEVIRGSGDFRPQTP